MNNITPIFFDHSSYKISPYGCGHIGFLSVYPQEDGSTQCTNCANKMRGFQEFIRSMELSQNIKDE